MIQQSGNKLWLEALQYDRIEMSTDSKSAVSSLSDEDEASGSTSGCEITAIASVSQP